MFSSGFIHSPILNEIGEMTAGHICELAWIDPTESFNKALDKITGDDALRAFKNYWNLVK